MQGPFDARALLAVAEAMIGVERSWEEDKIFACRARAVSSCVACSAGAAFVPFLARGQRTIRGVRPGGKHPTSRAVASLQAGTRHGAARSSSAPATCHSTHAACCLHQAIFDLSRHRRRVHDEIWTM